MSMPASARAASRCGHRGAFCHRAVKARMRSVLLRNAAVICSPLQGRLER